MSLCKGYGKRGVGKSEWGFERFHKEVETWGKDSWKFPDRRCVEAFQEESAHESTIGV